MLGTSLQEMDEGCGTLRAKEFEVKRCDAEHKWVCKKKGLSCSALWQQKMERKAMPPSDKHGPKNAHPTRHLLPIFGLE